MQSRFFLYTFEVGGDKNVVVGHHFTKLYWDKLFGATPEKGWIHLTSYLEPPVAPNSSLNGATGWFRIAY